jgi:glycosyltransferase involved in cell wall biosynthesis
MSLARRHKIVHIADDTALGGVSRMLDALLPGLGQHATHERVVVSAHALVPPNVKGADAVIVHSAMTWSKLPFLLALRVRMGRRPIIIVEHSYTAALERELVTARSRFRRMLRTAYRFADHVVSVSHGQADWLRGANLVCEPKLVVIPPISPCAGLEALPLSDRCGATSRVPLRLGASGRFCQAKGFSYLIDAMALLQDAPVHLTLAGYGHADSELRLQSKALANVEIIAPYSDPVAFLGGVDAVVVPSLWEAYGLLAMEARLAGRPVIVSDIDGLTEQVSPAFGRAVPSKDAAALARAIRDLCACDLGPMSLAARTSALGHVDASMAAWSKLLLSVLPSDGVPYSPSQHQFATCR